MFQLCELLCLHDFDELRIYRRKLVFSRKYTQEITTKTDKNIE